MFSESDTSQEAAEVELILTHIKNCNCICHRKKPKKLDLRTSKNLLMIQVKLKKTNKPVQSKISQLKKRLLKLTKGILPIMKSSVLHCSDSVICTIPCSHILLYPVFWFYTHSQFLCKYHVPCSLLWIVPFCTHSQ